VKGLGTGTTNGSGVATADLTGNLAGSVTVNARLGSLDDTLAFTVVPGALDHIQLTPDEAAISPGVPQTYATTAYDAAGNTIDVVSLLAALKISGSGTCLASSCTSLKKGQYRVTSTYSGETDMAHLTVRPH
jgi:hypothetical protein